MSDITLERGKALIITGPQGSGKSKLAREIAKRHGAYAELCHSAFSNPFDIGGVLDHEPAVIIVADGFPTHSRGLALVKQLITSETIERTKKSMETRTVRTPFLIFTLQDCDLSLLSASEARRFVIHHMGSEA